MYDIVGKRNWYFAFSALITIPGLTFILLGGLRPSVDFTGGTVWQVRFAERPTAEELQAALIELGHPEAEVRTLEDGFLEIRTDPIGLLPPQTPIPSASVVPSVSGLPSPSATATPTGTATGRPGASPSDSPSSPLPSPSPSPSATPGSPVPSPSPGVAPPPEGTEFRELQTALESRFGAAETPSVTTVGPLIGSELIRSSVILIVVGELFILGYLWLRFGFRFGTAAIVALLHDVIVVVGIFAILGYFFDIEFDALFVSALLTIIGFSVHDTIVVFDRIRENRIRHAGESFGAIVNHSILQTMARSIITSVTVLATLFALLLLGPPTIRTFTLALVLGVVSGTYSSVFNASQLLVAWYEWDAKRKARVGAAKAVRPLSR